MKTYPIDNILSQLKDTVLRNRSLVLQAPPGAGKTTRVPLALLENISPAAGRIVMLEPRRIAATSASRWMASILGEEVGATVGYTIRFDRRVSDATRIEVVTEGILTRRIQSDPGLDGVAMVIFDEFHERSLQADLALALCLDIQQNLREDLKIMVMSATLNSGPIAALLGNAPVITSEGKIFPVEERYLAETKEGPPAARAAEAVRRVVRETDGDILVFLPGAGEIKAAAEILRPALEQIGGEVHPLYGDLSFEEQERAIIPSAKRRIVLATNIAETSLTIEGVQVVVDSGLARRLQYDPSTGMNRLVTVSVSRASAEQRKGRAGRLGPGICYRLYSKYTFQSMVPFALPEILISDLSSLVLELAVWGVKDPSALSWLDDPPPKAWEAATVLLRELEALDKSGSVTAIGRKMARLPLHPRLSRLFVRAEEAGEIQLGADLAALLSERDIMRRGTGEPDLTERLELLRRWRREGKIAGTADLGALRAVDRTAKQLVNLIQKTERKRAERKDEQEMISVLLLAAFPDRLAKLREKESNGRYVLSHGRGVRFARQCSLAGNKYIIALNVDAGEKAEGVVHLAVSVDEDMLRRECSSRIEQIRRVEWERRERKVLAVSEERLGAIIMSEKPFYPTADETVPVVCEAIQADASLLIFNPEARKFMGRVALIQRAFPEEAWPDLSESHLASTPEIWLRPWLGSIRNARDLAGLNLLPALKAQLTWVQSRLLDERFPSHLVVPSGSRIALDYDSGDIPVLAVKLQEMFGLADTPMIAGGRVKVLLHLLSPARRPVQITQDLKGFWNSGYQQVKKELKGRYPKHPWPDDPWNALPTKRLKPKGT
ncbi:MAG: ATP-dependent helicase HrpB [Thermodesulfovibrio sp.]|nr:ATP-dependent helicase HrpB [Thermodesulfovibrio sp.]